MASTRQVAANRRNAKRSTGPRTQSGKSRSRANALRHGLRSKVVPDFALAAQMDELTRRIAREYGKSEHAVEVKIVVEAEMTILKIRAIRAKLLDKGEQDLPEAAVRPVLQSTRRPSRTHTSERSPSF